MNQSTFVIIRSYNYLLKAEIHFLGKVITKSCATLPNLVPMMCSWFLNAMIIFPN